MRLRVHIRAEVVDLDTLGPARPLARHGATTRAIDPGALLDDPAWMDQAEALAGALVAEGLRDAIATQPRNGARYPALLAQLDAWRRDAFRDAGAPEDLWATAEPRAPRFTFDATALQRFRPDWGLRPETIDLLNPPTDRVPPATPPITTHARFGQADPLP